MWSTFPIFWFMGSFFFFLSRTYWYFRFHQVACFPREKWLYWKEECSILFFQFTFVTIFFWNPFRTFGRKQDWGVSENRVIQFIRFYTLGVFNLFIYFNYRLLKSKEFSSNETFPEYTFVVFHQRYKSVLYLRLPNSMNKRKSGRTILKTMNSIWFYEYWATLEYKSIPHTSS